LRFRKGYGRRKLVDSNQSGDIAVGVIHISYLLL
jgi:hypothetical protein